MNSVWSRVQHHYKSSRPLPPELLSSESNTERATRSGPDAIEHSRIPGQASRRNGPNIGDRTNEERSDSNKQTWPCLDPLSAAHQLNHTLDVSYRSCWTIDGAEPDGHHFWATPSFAQSAPPMKIDVYVGGMSFCDAHNKENPNPQLGLLRQLEVHRMPLVQAKLIGNLPVATHISSALQHWAGSILDFEQKYFSMPFGSYVAIERLEQDPRQMRCELVPDHSVESHWLTLERLQGMWSIPTETWPPCLNHESLRYVQRIGDSVFLVDFIDPSTGTTRKGVFKSVSFDVKYMYHELRMLLSMSKHPNIQSRPLYIVVKRVRFGGKKGVCGFIAERLSRGSMLDHLRDQVLSHSTTIRQRVNWSRQIIEAMSHIRMSNFRYYSDLRPSNVMLRCSSQQEAELDIVLIDFEQRTPWYTEAPPEICWINLLERLAYGPKQSTLQEDCNQLLLKLNPAIRSVDRTDMYHGEFAGSSAFLYLDETEQEKAVVFMIGKLIWRIFEGASHSLDLISVEDFLGNPTTISFPDFNATPLQIRPLIMQCITCPPGWEIQAQRFAIQDSQLTLRSSHLEELDHTEFTDMLQAEARSWWTIEVDKAKRYCSMRYETSSTRASEMTGAAQRPGIQELLMKFNDLTASL